jgi:hypothetical protein
METKTLCHLATRVEESSTRSLRYTERIRLRVIDFEGWDWVCFQNSFCLKTKYVWKVFGCKEASVWTLKQDKFYSSFYVWLSFFVATILPNIKSTQTIQC